MDVEVGGDNVAQTGRRIRRADAAGALIVVKFQISLYGRAADLVSLSVRLKVVNLQVADDGCGRADSEGGGSIDLDVAADSRIAKLKAAAFHAHIAGDAATQEYAVNNRYLPKTKILAISPAPISSLC